MPSSLTSLFSRPKTQTAPSVFTDKTLAEQEAKRRQWTDWEGNPLLDAPLEPTKASQVAPYRDPLESIDQTLANARMALHRADQLQWEADNGQVSDLGLNPFKTSMTGGTADPLQQSSVFDTSLDTAGRVGKRLLRSVPAGLRGAAGVGMFLAPEVAIPSKILLGADSASRLATGGLQGAQEHPFSTALDVLGLGIGASGARDVAGIVGARNAASAAQAAKVAALRENVQSAREHMASGYSRSVARKLHGLPKSTATPTMPDEVINPDLFPHQRDAVRQQWGRTWMDQEAARFPRMNVNREAEGRAASEALWKEIREKLPSLSTRRPSLTALQQEVTPAPSATFLGMQPDAAGGEFPLFNIRGGPRHGFTVSEATLAELGIPVPPTRPPTAPASVSRPRVDMMEKWLTEDLQPGMQVELAPSSIARSKALQKTLAEKSTEATRQKWAPARAAEAAKPKAQLQAEVDQLRQEIKEWQARRAAETDPHLVNAYSNELKSRGVRIRTLRDRIATLKDPPP